MIPLILALVLTAGSSQERSIVINVPYAKAVRNFQRHMESIDQDKPQVGITVHTLTFTDANNREKVIIDGHFSADAQGQKMEVWMGGSIHETSEGCVFHFYSKKVKGPISFGNAWISMVKHNGGAQTLAKVHLEIQAPVPIPSPKVLPRLFYRARMALRTRIGNRIASGILTGVVSQGLGGMEKLVKDATKTYAR